MTDTDVKRISADLNGLGEKVDHLRLDHRSLAEKHFALDKQVAIMEHAFQEQVNITKQNHEDQMAMWESFDEKLERHMLHDADTLTRHNKRLHDELEKTIAPLHESLKPIHINIKNLYDRWWTVATGLASGLIAILLGLVVYIWNTRVVS